MQSSDPMNRAANLGEFNQQFARYEAAVDHIELPQFHLFVQNNKEYLKDESVNDRMFNLCNRIKVAEGEDTKPLDAIKKIVRQARITPAPIESVSKNVMKVISSNLETRDLVNLSKSSKTLQELTRGPLAPDLLAKITIGSKEWEKLGIVTRGPPLPANIDQILKSNCPFFEGKKVFQTHTLVLMPGGLSINELGQQMRHLREGDNETVFDPSSWNSVFNEVGDATVDEPYWALITNDVVPGSRGKLLVEQKELVEREGYEVSTISEAITLPTMHKEYSGENAENLLPEEPLTYARCADRVLGRYLSVGAFGPSGLSVIYSSHPNNIGVLAVRRFF